MSNYKIGAAAIATLIGVGAALPAEATPITVTWTGPATFNTPPEQSINFAPISGVFSFIGIDRGVVSPFEDFFLLLHIDGAWKTIASFQSNSSYDLANLPAVSFAAGTLDGIRFDSDGSDFTEMSNASFTFDRIDVNAVPEPGSLPLLTAALGALGIVVRWRGTQSH